MTRILKEQGLTMGSTVLAVTLVLGCSMDNEVGSDKYLCNDDQDCSWGWKCLSSTGGVKKCINTTGPDHGTNNEDGGAAVEDGFISDAGQPDIKGRLPDSTKPASCTPAVSECVDLGNYKTCNSKGTGYLPAKPCADFHRCDKGACLLAKEVHGIVNARFSKDYSILGQKSSARLWISFVYNDAPYSSSSVVPAVGTCQYNAMGSNPSNGVAFDAGNITIKGIPSGTRTLIYSKSLKRYETAPKLSPSESLWGKTLMFSSPGKNLIHGPFSGSLVVPPKRELTLPIYPATQLKSKPLLLKWSGSTGKGQLLIDLIDALAVGGPVWMRCNVNDTGSFTVPTKYLAKFDTNSSVRMTLRSDIKGPLIAKGLNAGFSTGTSELTLPLTLK